MNDLQLYYILYIYMIYYYILFCMSEFIIIFQVLIILSKFPNSLQQDFSI